MNASHNAISFRRISLFHLLSKLAAESERSERFKSATKLWKNAGELAPDPKNEHYCLCRSDVCQIKFDNALKQL